MIELSTDRTESIIPKASYWQVEGNERIKHKQVGALGFNRMLFGLYNTPTTFQKLMERSMRGLICMDIDGDRLAT